MAVRPPYHETSRIVPASTLVRKRLPIIRIKNAATTMMPAIVRGSISVPFQPDLQSGNRAPVRPGVHIFDTHGLAAQHAHSLAALLLIQPRQQVDRLAVDQNA